MRSIYFLICLLSSAVLLAGCGRPPSLPKKAPAVSAGQLPVITVIPGDDASYWNEAKRGALAAGKKLGATVKWAAPTGPDFAKSQNDLIKKASEGSHGLVVAPADPTELIRGFGEAARAGLAIVAMDRDVYTIQNKLSLVENDDDTAGALAARKIGKWSLNKDRYAAGVWVPSPEDHEATARYNAFKDTMTHEFPGVIVQEYPAAEDGKDRLPPPAMFFPDIKSAGNAHNYWGASKVIVCAQGEEWMQALQKEQIAVLISPDYYEMGYQSVKAILDYRALKDPPKTVAIPPLVMTKKLDKPKRGKALA